MAKYNIENLTPFKSKWHNKPTTVIRVPEILVDQILEYAHQLDLEKRPKKIINLVEKDKIRLTVTTELKDVDLTSLTISEIRDYLHKLKRKFKTNMKKSELINLLEEALLKLS